MCSPTVPARPVCGTASTRCRSTSTHRRQTGVTARRPNRPDSVGQMPHVLRRGRPELRNPVLVSGFEGWNDAGEAASFAARFLAERWDAEPFAEVDPEDFFDFTSTRPHVR